jgi:hypothetical protein
VHEGNVAVDQPVLQLPHFPRSVRLLGNNHCAYLPHPSPAQVDQQAPHLAGLPPTFVGIAAFETQKEGNRGTQGRNRAERQMQREKSKIIVQ